MWVQDWIETDKVPPPYHTKIIFYAGALDGILIGAFYRASHKFQDTDGNRFYKSDITHWTHMLPAPDKIKEQAL